MVWKDIQRPEIGTLCSHLSELLRRQSESDSGRLPDFLPKVPLWLVSDYGGKHDGSTVETYSFYCFQPGLYPQILEELAAYKRSALRDRSMAYKKLNDGVRQRALGGYLNIVHKIPSLVITYAVDRELSREYLLRDAPQWVLDYLSQYSPSVRGHIDFLITFLSLTIAGLSQPGQVIGWLTDQDDAVVKDSLARPLVKVVYLLASAMADRWLGPFHGFVTGPHLQYSEDVASIPDLAAGAVSAYLTEARRRGAVGPGPLPSITVPRKAVLMEAVAPSWSLVRHWVIHVEAPQADSEGNRGMYRFTRYNYSFVR